MTNQESSSRVRRHLYPHVLAELNQGGPMRTPAAGQARRRTSRRSPTKRTTTRTAPSPVAGYIDGWSPTEATARKHWLEIQETVRVLVGLADPSSVRWARRFLSSLAFHTGHAFSQGMNITDHVALLGDASLAITVGAAAKNNLKDNSRRTYLTYLRRLRARALPGTYGENTALRSLGKSPVAEPYTASEVRGFLTYCQLGDDIAAQRLLPVVLLGFGCGLDGREATHVTGEDVMRTKWGLVVHAVGVGKRKSIPERVIPVRAEYEKALAQLAQGSGKQALTRSNLNRSHINDIAHSVPDRTGMPTFNAPRARSTWIRSLLLDGVCFVALRRAGAASQAERGLFHLSRDVPITDEKYISTVRGSATHFDAGDKAFDGLHPWSGQ